MRQILCFTVACLLTLALFGCATTPPAPQALIPMYVTVGNPPQTIQVPNAYTLVPYETGVQYARALMAAAEQQRAAAAAAQEDAERKAAEDLRVKEAVAAALAAAKPKPAPKPAPTPPPTPPRPAAPLPMTPPVAGK